MISIDGIEWRVPCQISRTAEIRASEISGLMLDKSYFNDVIGTYMSYTVQIAVPLNMRDAYIEIYEKLTDPVDGHVFILPYNGGTVQITGRVEDVSDQYVRLPGGETYWRGTTFTVIANHPTKSKTLDEVIQRGRSPLPEVTTPATGVLYMYTANGWVKVEYPDADNTYY